MIAQQYRELTLSEIVPNPHNPRKRFSGPKYDEMVDSVREKGVISPILVRPLPDGRYEIIFGETRFRASCQVANEAGKKGDAIPVLETIPALVRDLTDDQAFDFMTIENLQRQDLTDLEEARGFKSYVDKKGEGCLPELAEKIGINIRYIRNRLAVLSLPAVALEKWDAGELKYGHLEQLTRVGDEEKVVELVDRLDGGQYGRRWTVGDLKRSIDADAPELMDAPFDIKGCSRCQRNSSTQKELFGIGDDGGKCMNRACYDEKLLLHMHENENEVLKEHGTTRFILRENIDYGNFGQFWDGIPEKCTGEPCESLVTSIYMDGRVCHRSACVGPKECHASAIKERDGEKPEEGKSAPPRNHGEEFREKYYAEAIPKEFGLAETQSHSMKQLLLFALIKSNGGLQMWFGERHTIESQYGYPDDADVFRVISNLSLIRLGEELHAATLEVTMQDNFGAKSRRMVADHIGIDLEKEWVITEEYLKKKQIRELLQLGEDLGVFQDPKAKEYVRQLGKVKLEHLKKAELIDVFLKSGVELQGKVPWDILSE